MTRLAGATACSPVQERLWFLEQLVPGSGRAFNVCTATRLRGRVDASALNTALTELCRRHESLRTSFAVEGDRPMRLVAPADAAVFEADVRRVAPDEVTAAAREVAMTNFDLASAPLANATLLETAPDEAVLVLCLSHAVADGWSMGIVHRELSALYDAALHGKPSPLPELEEDFGDWVVEAERRGAEGRERTAAFWREELAGAPETVELPTDRRRPAVERYVGSRSSVEIPAELAAAVAEASRRLGTTPFAVYLAAWAAVLADWCGQRDFVVGSPWANRRTIAQEAIVGPLMDVLLIRIDANPRQTVEALVKSIRRRAVRAMAHSDLGFDQVVAELRPVRDAGRNPLFQTMFTLQNAPLEPLALPGCAAEPFEVVQPTSRLDLALELGEANGRTAATLEYSTDLVDEVTIGLVCRRFVHVLGQMAADPLAELGTLRAIDAAEEELVVRRFNDTAAPVPEPLVVHELVDRAAAATPHAVALEADGDRVTYAELVRRSRALACVLLRRGVTRGSVVGVRLERSAEMVVALLAVLRCGAAYLPLDPDLPELRLAEIVADAGARLVLDAETVGTSEPVPLPAVSPDDLAYVMYTSGSTGRPKGVMVPHRAVAHYLHWAQRELPLSRDDRMLAKTPFTFDISVWEIFGTLAAGARLVLAAPGKHRDSSYVADLLAEARITVTHFVPSMLRGLTSLPRLPAWPALRLVIAGGEALPADLCARLAEHTGASVVNFYGPTEATIYVSWTRAGERVAANGLVPIGLPVANTHLVVLDEDLRPVPLGAPGELYIGGVQVADGYLRRPGRTATRFLPDPFSTVPGTRMYRTGDLVRRAADGTLDFLGRLDNQIKLRGFRIELGEIEATARAHPAVANAAVELRSSRLVAHLAGEPVDAAELRDFLGSRLPEYMVPAHFVWHERLPLTTSGKLDRNRLAEVELAAEPSERATAPAGPVERIVAEAWAEILGAPVTDVHANFFELGGDSITLVAVVAELDRRGLDVTVSAVFERPTVAALAQVAQLRPEAHAPEAERLPLTPLQRELLALPAAERLHVVSAPAPDDLPLAMRACERRLRALRLDFDAVEGDAFVTESPRGLTADFESKEAARAWLRETVDAAAGRPWAVALVDDSELLVGVDALVCDAGAIGRLLDTLGALPAPPVEELPCKTTAADILCTAVALTLGPESELELAVQEPLRARDGELEEPRAVRLPVASLGTSLPEVLRSVRRGLRQRQPVPLGDGAPALLVRIADGSFEPAPAPVLPSDVVAVFDPTNTDLYEEAARVREAVVDGDAAAYVPEDFPLATLSEDDLARLTKEFPYLEDVAPLGPMQQYALDRLQRTDLDGLFVVCFTATIDHEGFDVEAWRKTWAVLQERHGGLRTSFLDMSTGPVQLVHRRLELPFEVVDLRPLGREAALAEVLRQETAERAHHVRPEDAPQWVMRVFRIGEDEYRLICRLVYLLQDGWSVSVLQDEWYPLYDAFREGREPALPPPAAPYTAHIRTLARRDLAAAEAYWLDQLRGVDLSRSVSEALRRRSRPAESGLEHQTCPLVVSPTEEQALRAFARREHLTLFTPLQGAWAMLLSGLTGRRQVLFGTISSGRSSPDVERTYGPFNNMMPTVVDVDPGAAVRDFLRDLQGAGSVARGHDFVPLPRLVRALGLPEGTDLLDAYVVHENFPVDRDVQRRFGGWRPDIVEMRTEHALRMLIWPVGELSFHLSFDARITCPRDAERLIREYRRILLALAAGEERVERLVRDPLAT